MPSIIKKIFSLISTFVVVFSTFSYGGSVFSFPSVFAQSSAVERTNLVAILVDNAIYGSIKTDLDWYVNTYIPKQSPGMDALVIPLEPDGFDSVDVQHILQNIYFDGHKSKSTDLVGVIVFGDIPLPPVEVDGEIFYSIYPYTDLEGDPLFRYDYGRGVFVSNGNSSAQPELRHSVIPGRDVGLFSKFFEKVRQYYVSPSNYATGSIWYDDYQGMQQSFTKEELDEYINTLLFSEDRSQKRINRATPDIFSSEYADDLIEMVVGAEETHGLIASEGLKDAADHPDVEAAHNGVFAGTADLISKFDKKELADAISSVADNPVPTLINSKQTENNFRTVFSLFGDDYLSQVEDNIAAGGRYDTLSIDSSLEMIQLKDTVAKQYLEDMNLFLEQALDKQIQAQQYALKYPLPTWHEHWKSTIGLACGTEGGLQNGESFGGEGAVGIGTAPGRFMHERYENFYFGRYAGDVQEYSELHVYRGSGPFKNSPTIFSSPLPMATMDDTASYDWENGSVGASFGGASQQVRSMRGFEMDLAPDDLELYEETKCKRKDSVNERALDYRGGGSPLNLDSDRLEANPTDIDFDEDYYDTKYMWHPTVNRSIGGPQYDPAGAALIQDGEIQSDVQMGYTAHNDYSEVVRVDDMSRFVYINTPRVLLPGIIRNKRANMYCDERVEKDDYPFLTPFEEMDFFWVWENELPDPQEKKVISLSQNPYENGGGVDQVLQSSVAYPVIDDGGAKMSGWEPRFLDQVIPSGLEFQQDTDEDLRPDYLDSDLDGDGFANEDDGDVDGDNIWNDQDEDIDGDGRINRGDLNIDGDAEPNDSDGDRDGDGLVNDDWNDESGQADDAAESSEDTDSSGCKCGGGGSCGRCNQQKAEDGEEEPPADPDEEDPELESPFDLEVKDRNDAVTTLGELFDDDSDYLVIDASSSGCTYCRDLSAKYNGSVLLQEQLTNECSFVTVVPKDDVKKWQEVSGGQNSFVGEHSWEIVLGQIRNLESYFEGGQGITGIPHIFIVDKDGVVVTRSLGGTPPDLSTYCPGGEGESSASLFGELVFAQEVDVDPQIQNCVPLPQLDDIDGDGILNRADSDVDGDGVLNGDDEDIDGDCIPNGQDFDDIDGDGIPNDEDDDIDGDGIPDGKDRDCDGDGIPNGQDGDCNGNGTPNGEDSDVDGDGVENGQDNDTDGDGIENGEDSDVDGDGVENGQDNDTDGDGIENGEDGDVDGDGLDNQQDGDIDGDGEGNDTDSDVDGDGQDNGADGDIDGDGIPNGEDSDVDGDGVDNSVDNDIDGDGIPNELDFEDIDGDGIPNDQDDDMDGDGISNDQDRDMDGDGRDNSADGDCNCNGKPNSEESDDDGDGIPDADDPSPQGFGSAEDEFIPGHQVNYHIREKTCEFFPDLINTNTPGDEYYGFDPETGEREQYSAQNKTFKDRYYRDYHIIDTVTQHKGPTNNDLNHSTIMTFERPIDDPGYTTFHGIGGSMVKMIYLDMYNVSTYQGGNLLSEEEIESELRTYLREKVTVFNEMLQEQLSNSPSHYSTHPDAFDFLGSVHFAATPNRTYDLIPDDFFESLLGDQEITRIAHSLYYLNYGREKRPTGESGVEFLENARNEFDLNRKLEYVAEKYLLREPNVWADDPIRLPRYIDSTKNKAYEIAYINSDGYDAISHFGQDIVYEEVAPPEGRRLNEIGNTTHSGYKKASEDAEKVDQECNVPEDGAVPLLQRPAAFACWLKETLENPVSLELTVDISFDDGTIIQNMLDRLDTSEEQSAGSDSTGGTNPQSPRNDDIVSRGSDGVDGQRGFLDGVFSFLSVYAQETDDTERKEQLGYGFSASITPTAVLTPGDKGSELVLATDRDLGGLSVTVSSDSSSVFVAGKDISLSPLELFSEFAPNEKYQITTENTVSGEHTLQVSICSGVVCTNETVPFFISQGELEYVQLIAPSPQVDNDALFPVSLRGFDENNNLLPFSSRPITLTVEGGEILNQGGTFSSISVVNFDNSVYIQPQSDATETLLTVIDEETKEQLGALSVTISEIDLNLSYTDTYRLPDASVGFTLNNDTSYQDVLKETLLPITIQLEGAEDDFLVPVSIKSTGGSLVLGTVSSENEFIETETLLVVGDRATFYGYPTGDASNEQITIFIPGFGSQTLSVEVLPSGVDDVTVDISTNGTEIIGEVFVKDSWGNVFYEQAQGEVRADGGRSPDSSIFEIAEGMGTFRGTISDRTQEGGARVRIRQDGSSVRQNGGEEGPSLQDEKEFKTQQFEPLNEDDRDTEDGDFSFSSETFTPEHILRPDERQPQDVNVMYLNLYGKDRGNEQRVIDMLKNEKTISITTTQKIKAQSELIDKETTLTADGSRDDELEIIKSLLLIGEHVRVELGNDGAIGRVYMGTSEQLGLSYTDVSKEKFFGPKDTKEPPVRIKKISSTCSQKKNVIYVDTDVIGVDFETGYMHPQTNIVPSDIDGAEWTITYKGEPVASFAFQLQEETDFDPLVEDNRFEFQGQSETEVTVIYSDNGEREGKNIQYPSLSSAGEASNSIGFRDSFHGITNFAQGQTVGVANKFYADVSLINYGDPFLKKVKDNDKVQKTTYDSGIGQLIYASQKNILKVSLMDLEQDNKDDIVIGYNDGSLRILKNYGGGEPYSDLGSLVVIADGMKDFFPGDADGDGDDDIIVLTESKKLRLYKNDTGVLEVDGTPICIDVPNGKYGSVGQVNQLFIQDIDGSGTLDIVTNSTDGEIEVFFGGGNSYISTDPDICDEDALSRNNVSLLTDSNITADEGFSDNSLIHRDGLEINGEEPIVDGYEERGDGFDMEMPKIKNRKQAEKFVEDSREQSLDRIDQLDIDQLVEDGKEKSIDYIQQAPDYLKPYEHKTNEAYAYMRIQDTRRSANSDIQVSKSVEDKNGGFVEKGDILTITVKMEGSGSGIDYLERLEIPVLIFKDEYNVIQGFDRGTIPDNVEINWNIGNGYEFMIIGLNEPAEFSYDVQFDGNGYTTIGVETEKDDHFQQSGARIAGLFPSVQAQGTSRKINIYTPNMCRRSYQQSIGGGPLSLIDLEGYYQEKFVQPYLDAFEEKFDNTVEDIKDYDISTAKKLMGIHEQSYNISTWKKISDALGGITPGSVGSTLLGGQGSASFEVGTEYVGQFSDMVQESLDGLCNGFKIGESNCGGLPVPFNMAFSSPGTYNVFGCKLTEDRWHISPLFFPATLQTPAGPVPSVGPVGQKGPGDGFLRAGGGTYSSQFRLYMSPTLTGGLGISMCFGPYKTGMKIPSPIGDIAGNCIVMATSILPQCDDGGDAYEAANGTPREKTTASIEPEVKALQGVGTCDPTLLASSPFSDDTGRVAFAGKPKSRIVDVYTGRPNYPRSNTQGISGAAQGSQNNPDQGSLGVEQNSSSSGSSGGGGGGGGGSYSQEIVEFDRHTIKGGTEFDLQIEGGNVRGLVSCIVRGRFDKQIRYVANNLLTMNVTVILPDMEELTEGRGEIARSEGIPDIISKAKKTDVASQEAANVGSNAAYIDEDTAYHRNFMTNNFTERVEGWYANPFEGLRGMFEEIELLSFEEERIKIQFPFIFGEDLARLEVHMKAWIDRNQKIAQSRKQLSPDRQLNVDGSIEQMRQNLLILEEYKRFPTQLYQYTHARDKYASEVIRFADQLIGDLTGWLQVNADRFSQYVDTIILIIGIVETRQPLIDFSMDRKTKCAKCRQDNYDYYSCKLKLLCVDLPILPIPPFRLPDIVIDVSQIRLGIDIMLPRFVFIPEMVYRPQLPDLPDPRNFELNLDVDLPEIPLLPRPPQLPDLPDLELEADITLPTLPPPPKIPNIMPAIKATLTIADLIGEVFCVIKGGIGLVAEQSVKTRIEQMTQRTWTVEPFDSISLTFPESKLQGYDYRIDAMVDLQISFSGLVDIFEALAEGVNEKVSTTLDDVKENFVGVQDVFLDESGIGDFLDNAGAVGEIIEDGGSLDVEVDLGGTGRGETTGKRNGTYVFERPTGNAQLDEYFAISNAGGEYSVVKQRLTDQINYVLNRFELRKYHSGFEKVLNRIHVDSNVTPNKDGVRQVLTSFTADVEELEAYYGDVSEQILTSFDLFVQDQKNLVDLVSQDDGTVRRSYGTSLFTADQKVLDRIWNQPHPVRSWMDYHKPLVDGFSNALEKNTAADLSMNELTYEATKTYIGSLQEKFSGSHPTVQHLSSEESRRVVAQISGENLDETEEDICEPLLQDEDIDDDGILNEDDEDRDGDGIPDVFDFYDMDGDCISNSEDSDIDGDGVENSFDRDMDGDEQANQIDGDCNGNGIPNESDSDDDSDGIPDSEDATPTGPDGESDEEQESEQDGESDDQENSSGDIDGDGIPDEEDQDIDGDGIPNGEDSDVDGDGTPNGSDADIDGDGIPNGQDYEDLDGDGIENDVDPDMDNDGQLNQDDPDMDNDGEPNYSDGDCNCNGQPDSSPEETDTDFDDDGIENEDDETPKGPDEDDEQQSENEDDEQQQEQSGSFNSFSLPDEKGMDQIDYVQYIDGFFIEGSDKKYHNVIGRSEKGEEILNAGSYSFSDVNGDGGTDILLRDSNTIYVKYDNIKDKYSGGGGNGSYVEIGPWNDVEQLEQFALGNDGYVQDYKVRDKRRVIDGYKRDGVNYSGMGYTRENSNDDAFIVRLTHRVSNQMDKNGSVHSGGPEETMNYLLVVPQDIAYSGYNLEIPFELPKENIQDLIDDGTITQVRTYDGKSDNISTLLENIAREWYHAKVAPIDLEKESGGFFRKSGWTYKRSGPRSHQDVGGAQKRGDELKPTLDLELIRDLTSEVVTQGYDMSAQVLTQYTLSGTRIDNGTVVENRIVYDEELIYVDKSDRAELVELYYEYPTIEKFVFGAIDQNGNQTLVDVQIAVDHPEISITDIRYLSPGYEIETELTETIDDGKVTFIRDRYGRREDMNPLEFSVNPTDPEVVGGVFVNDTGLDFYDSSGNKRCNCNKDTAEVIVEEEFVDQTDIRVDFSSGEPVLSVVDIPSQDTLFKIGLEPESLVGGSDGITVLDGSFALSDIDDTTAPPNAGQNMCLSRGSACHIFISPEGDIYVPPEYSNEYEAEYGFDSETQSVVYTIIDGTQNPVASVSFIAEPLE